MRSFCLWAVMFALKATDCRVNGAGWRTRDLYRITESAVRHCISQHISMAPTASLAIWKSTRISLNIQDDGGLPAALGLCEREAMQCHRFHIHPHAVTAGIDGLTDCRRLQGVWLAVGGYA